MNMRQVAQQWLDDSYKEMKRLAKATPGSIPGWGLRPGNIMTKFNDVEALFARFKAIARDFVTKEVPEGEVDRVIQQMFMQCVDIRKKDLEGKVRNVTGLKGQGLMKKMDELEEGIVDSKQNDDSLVKEKLAP
jgi:hypothetical protein